MDKIEMQSCSSEQAAPVYFAPARFVALANEAGISVSRAGHVVAVGSDVSSAEPPLLRFAKLVARETQSQLCERIVPNFDAIADKRMSELTERQQQDAHEAWLRAQLPSFDEYHQRQLSFLLGRLDEVRATCKPVA